MQKISFAVVLSVGMILGGRSLYGQEVSSGTVSVPELSSAPVPAANLRQLNAAIETLNYKIELIQSRYIQQGRDIDDLRTAERDQNKVLAEQRLSLPDPKRFASMDAELQLMRSDIAQLKEDVALMKTSGTGNEEEVGTEATGQKSVSRWIRKNWLSASALLISIVVLAAH